MAFSVSAKKTKKKRSLTDIVPQHYMANRTFQLPKTPGSCLKLEVSTFIYSGLANRWYGVFFFQASMLWSMTLLWGWVSSSRFQFLHADLTLTSIDVGLLCYRTTMLLVCISLHPMCVLLSCVILGRSQETSVTAPSYNTGGQYTAPILLFSFLIGLVCCKSALLVERYAGWQIVTAMTMSSAIEAGVSTMWVVCRFRSSTKSIWLLDRFVGLGEDPQVLAIRAPSLFAVRALVCNNCMQWLTFLDV